VSAAKRKKGRGRKIGKAQKAAEEAAAAAEETAEEAKAAEARRASARHASDARIAGSVAEVNASPADRAACAEAERMLTVEQVALRKMRAQRHGWVCALWLQEQLHVFLARDLEGVADGEEGWIEKVVAGGGKERAPVRVTKEQLESQHMVVMDEQEFFFFDIDRVDSDDDGDPAALNGAFDAVE